MRELRSAVLSDTQIIALLEVDQARGALDPPQIRTIVGELDWPEAERERALDKLFAEGTDPIEWTRLGSLQTLTLRLIAERLLPPRVGGHAGRGPRVRGEREGLLAAAAAHARGGRARRVLAAGRGRRRLRNG